MNAFQPWHVLVLLLLAGLVVAFVVAVQASNKRTQPPVPPPWQGMQPPGYPPGYAHQGFPPGQQPPGYPQQPGYPPQGFPPGQPYGAGQQMAKGPYPSHQYGQYSPPQQPQPGEQQPM
ncbi:hypothetical protein [Amycolatopsis sp. NPDC051903]|uniref:hypothetical protein n=1 Tax=Amycolatopsis sp. NPDC051903 TaxID=3363936 RepID=UPI00378E66FA